MSQFTATETVQFIRPTVEQRMQSLNIVQVLVQVAVYGSRRFLVLVIMRPLRLNTRSDVTEVGGMAR